MSEKNFKNYLNVYEFDYTLPGTGEKIKFKPFTTYQMKKLLNYENENDIKIMSRVLDELIQSNIISENFDIDEIYIRDRFSLLIEMRKKTKGELYKFQFDCPKCNSQILQSVDLDKLDVKQKDSDIGVINVADNVNIEISHIKRKDEKEAIEHIKDGLDESEREIEYNLNTLSSCIRSIETPDGKDGDLTFEDKRYIIDNSVQSVLDDIGEWFSDNWFGIDFTFEMKCRNCDFKSKRQIPMNQLFS